MKELRALLCLPMGEIFCAATWLTLINVFLQDFEVVDNEESAEWEKEIEDMLEEENDIQ